MQSNTPMANGITARQLQLMNTLHTLWMDHVIWTRSFIESTAFNLEDLQFVTNRLLRNPVDFANVLRPFYGEQNAERFRTLLTDHLMIAGQLVNAAKAQNAAAVQEQRRRWYANADELADFLSRINPNWTRREWQTLLYEHLKMTEDEAVQILTGQYAAGVAQFDAIRSQAMRMADEMADGIIRQFQIR
ncbi:acetylglutamate kinase [Acetanaerobacterium elongatum]|uniref:Acetylglutamate kinase n=1 Tax=Acetanaerobacterium elongatum TaxID=258515 RepID=A0A1H0E0J9_9FIRM|nr:acetylglutamate kinase [Acetanaerobacterium elongatum]SDN75964.1 hypothetical protein SAMN05192585_13122 [Acetanaerobacterium elongatum]